MAAKPETGSAAFLPKAQCGIYAATLLYMLLNQHTPHLLGVVQDVDVNRKATRLERTARRRAVPAVGRVRVVKPAIVKRLIVTQ
jgi:hypothetical protein